MMEGNPRALSMYARQPYQEVRLYGVRLNDIRLEKSN